MIIPTSTPDVYELHVDNSNKELFETCARAAEYYTVRRRELDSERGALQFGGIIHEALVPRKLASIDSPDYFNWKVKQPVDFAGLGWEELQEKIVLNAFSTRPSALDEWRTADRAIESLHLYNKQWPLDKEPFAILPGTVELPFKIRLGVADLDSTVTTHAGTFYVKSVEVFWTGRMDGLVSYDNQILVLDHKTTTVLGPTFFDDFVLSSQMHGYTWAARKLGYDAKGLLLDVLALRKPSRNGTPNEFVRQRYFYNDPHLDEWEKDTFTHVTDFLEHLCRGYWPRSTKWCHGRYGQCQYWPVCTQLPNNRDQLLYSEVYRDVTWSPLNGLPTKELNRT